MKYLFERVSDVEADCRHFSSLSDPVDPGKRLLFKGRIPEIISHQARNNPTSSVPM